VWNSKHFPKMTLIAVDCEHYQNDFPKKVARGLDADREVKAIFYLASKQSTAVETSKIWQHALRASNGCFSRGANLSRNAS